MTPMTGVQYLQTALDNVRRNLADMTANPKPNYSVNGQSVSWQSLYDSYLNSMLKLEQALQRAGGPFEVRSYGQ